MAMGFGIDFPGTEPTGKNSMPLAVNGVFSMGDFES
jgi:hypothetical protein